jgi:serine protease Do
MILLGVMPWCGAWAGRLPVDDLKAPTTRGHLMAIQDALIKALPKARKATVCIDLGEGAGSGVIVSADGIVLTAAHVTSGVGKELTVVMEDGRKVKAESLGLVASCDCAMVKLTEPGPWPFVEIDREDSVKVGDWVFSVGHSGGFDKSRGSVVRIGRVVRMDESTMQTDCTLIGGDSGGPLFDLTGTLVGIHSRVGLRLEENMHVPMREFVKNWDGLHKGELIGEGPFAKKPEKGKGFLGFASQDRDGGGLDVTKVGRETPAEAAGIKQGDVLRKMDGVDIRSKEQFQKLLGEKSPGDKVQLEFERGGKPLKMEVRLGER